ncbi:hypothetical protein GQ600_1753 [Phytophthora cactorum]|nr:hypothetical protein GQ600_1753 [Phytophthora cactorum]
MPPLSAGSFVTELGAPLTLSTRTTIGVRTNAELLAMLSSDKESEPHHVVQASATRSLTMTDSGGAATHPSE